MVLKGWPSWSPVASSTESRFSTENRTSVKQISCLLSPLWLDCDIWSLCMFLCLVYTYISHLQVWRETEVEKEILGRGRENRTCPVLVLDVFGIWWICWIWLFAVLIFMVQVYVAYLTYIYLWLTRVGLITLIWSFQVFGNSRTKSFPHLEGIIFRNAYSPHLGDIPVLSRHVVGWFPLKPANKNTWTSTLGWITQK